MKRIIFLILTLTTLFASSCNKDPLYIDGPAGDMVGHWIDQEYSDTLYLLRRASHIPADTFGWTFNEDGTVMNRANAGFCGTPPITYADYEGDWFADDSIITINVEFWGGTTILEWQLIEVSETSLIYYQRSMDLIQE